MYRESTIAAIATPPGMGGIAVIRLSGPQSYGVAARVFRPTDKGRKLEDAKGYTALYGDFLSSGVIIDNGIALCFHAPHSYTGEDVVELSCHGGEAVSRAVLHACLAAGAEPAPPGEYTRRAVLNGRLSLTQAEAVMDLISANSQKGVLVAHAAHGGALAKAIGEIRQKLVELAGHLAAWTDYPEEDVEDLEQGHFLEAVCDAELRLQQYIDGYESGQMAMRGVRTAIIGSPNVGKSTLFNLLSGFERAIVTPVAGTTRDVVREQIQVGGVALQLSDTAGLHETEDIVEKEGIRRSMKEMENAQLVIAVFDGSQPLDDAQLSFAQECKGRRSLAVVNKSDLGLKMDEMQLAPYFSNIVVVSAIGDDARETIENAVLCVLEMETFDSNAALLANERQLSAAVLARDALDEAAAALRKGLSLDAAGVCLDDAIRALYALTGEDASEAIIEEVFSKFCVGK